MYEVLTRMCVKGDEKRYLLVNLCSKCMRFLLECVLKEMRNDTYW